MYDPRNTWYQLKKDLRVLPVFLKAGYIRLHFDRKKSLFIMVSTLGGGGAQKVATVLANELSDRYHVSVLITRDVAQTYPLSDNVEVIRMRKEGLDDRQYGKLVVLYKKFRRPAASISFMFDSNRMNLWGDCRCKTICCERNNPAKKAPGLLEKTAAQYRKADHVIFQSEAVRSLYDEDIRAHSTILPNPVSVTCYASPVTRHRIVTAGRLHPQKNQAMLIRAFAAFLKDHPDYTLSIYGKGELEEELKQLAGALGVEKAVIFHGNVENIHPEIADAEMFVLPSDFEGLSNALLEAMTMGIPCISTACEGSTDVIRTGENGMLTPVGDEDALLRAMETLADDEPLRRRIGEEGRRTGEGFHKEAVAQRWIEVIEKVIAEK